MGCVPFKTPSGITGIICSRTRTPRCECKRASEFQCDWKVVRKGKKKTCDKHLCATHATEVAPDKHLCPEHLKAYGEWKERKPK